MRSRSLLVLLAALLMKAPVAAFAGTTIFVINYDLPGTGFNDPTPAEPIGGNSGTTIGEQRLIAFQAAADIWGAHLDSVPVIRVAARFLPLDCSATSAVLASSGTTEIWRGSLFPFNDTWYHFALANKLYGATIDPTTPEIVSYFNSSLGQANCLTGLYFYYGLDGAHGTNLDLVTVVLHELAHGLGFPGLAGQAGEPGNRALARHFVRRPLGQHRHPRRLPRIRCHPQRGAVGGPLDQRRQR